MHDRSFVLVGQLRGTLCCSGIVNKITSQYELALATGNNVGDSGSSRKLQRLAGFIVYQLLQQTSRDEMASS